MDIVERLRSPNFADKINMVDLHNQAADEIERLREALDWALNHISGHCTYDNVDQVVNCLEKAHAALKGQS